MPRTAMQLNLLDWVPEPELMVEPEPCAALPAVKESTMPEGTRLWLETGCTTYLRLMTAIALSTKLSPDVKRRETARLQAMRRECLDRLEKFQNLELIEVEP